MKLTRMERQMYESGQIEYSELLKRHKARKFKKVNKSKDEERKLYLDVALAAVFINCIFLFFYLSGSPWMLAPLIALGISIYFLKWNSED